MKTFSFKLADNDAELVQKYVATNGINLSTFVRETLLEAIEDDLALDEERILRARELAKTEKNYDHTEVWEMLEL